MLSWILLDHHVAPFFQDILPVSLRLYDPVCPVATSPGEQVAPSNTFGMHPLETPLIWLISGCLGHRDKQ